MFFSKEAALNYLETVALPKYNKAVEKLKNYKKMSESNKSDYKVRTPEEYQKIKENYKSFSPELFKDIMVNSMQDKMAKRQEANRTIIEMLKIMVESYPELRFGQILDNMGIIPKNQDIFYIESVDTLQACKQYFIDHGKS